MLVASFPWPISEAGERAAFHSVEFFTARIPNPNTRAAYGHAVPEFYRWCELRAISLLALSSPLVAIYFHELAERLSPPSANLHLSGFPQWLEWLARTGVLPSNPAAVVRGARLSREEGKTPVLDREQARRLFASLDDAADAVVCRDRAILAVMLYGFVRVGAGVRMRVRDFHEHEGQRASCCGRRGGKER